MLGAFRGDRELHKLYDKDLFLENKIENCSLQYIWEKICHMHAKQKTINQAFYSGGGIFRWSKYCLDRLQIMQWDSAQRCVLPVSFPMDLLLPVELDNELNGCLLEN